MREAIIVACGLLRGKMEGVSKKEKKMFLVITRVREKDL